MKKTLIFIILIALIGLYFSCNKDNTVNPNANLIPVSTVSGTIDSWNLGSGYSLKVYTGSHLMQKTTVGSNGSFSFTFPAILIDSLLTAINFTNDSTCSGNVTIKPSGLKVAGASFDMYDANDSLRGYLYYRNGTSWGSGIVEQFYEYFSGAGSITGTYTCTYSGFTSKEILNLNYPKGWYYIDDKYDSVSSNYDQLTINNTVPAGMKWIYYPFYNDRHNNRLLK